MRLVRLTLWETDEVSQTNTVGTDEVSQTNTVGTDEVSQTIAVGTDEVSQTNTVGNRRTGLVRLTLWGTDGGQG